MSDGKVIPLRAGDISPADVLQALQDDIQRINEVFVVAMTDDGPAVYAAGNLGLLAYAALVLQDVAMKGLNGELISEGPGGGAAG